jgi:inhibitor of KinA sporulation pathway (predicted exonuclease)
MVWLQAQRDKPSRPLATAHTRARRIRRPGRRWAALALAGGQGASHKGVEQVRAVARAVDVEQPGAELLA